MDGITLMAEALRVAHVKYETAFGVPVHGTAKQFAALIELCPQMRSAIELWNKQREEMETV